MFNFRRQFRDFLFFTFGAVFVASLIFALN